MDIWKFKQQNLIIIIYQLKAMFFAHNRNNLDKILYCDHDKLKNVLQKSTVCALVDKTMQFGHYF